jgi:putative heme-binding domain-containing protein
VDSDAWQALNLYAGSDAAASIVCSGNRQRRRSPAFEIPDLTKLDDVELVALLGSSNGWRRDSAQMLLVQQEARLSAKALVGLERAASGDETALAQIHALNVLDGRQSLSANVLSAALRSADPLVLREAVRISETHLNEADVLNAVLSLAEHDDIGVRLQVALSLGETDDPRAAEALAGIAARAEDDPWLHAAVLSSVNGQADATLAALLHTTVGHSPNAALVQQLVATALADDPVAGLERLADLLAPPDAADVADWQMLALGACLDAFERGGLDCAKLAQSAETAALVTRIAPLFAAARGAAGQSAAPLERRLSAAQLLGRGPDHAEDDRAVLASWLAPQNHPDVQSAAIFALARLRTDDVPGLLLQHWPNAAPFLRARILETLLSRENWTESLLSALADGVLTAADLDAVARARLSGHPRESLRTRAAELLGAPTSADREQVIASFQSVFELDGDAERGKAVFKSRCAACHQHNGVGVNVGAQLGALTNKTTDLLVTAVLDPNRAVEFKYLAYNVLTTDGRVLSGLIVEESATSLTIAKADGTRDTVLRSEIETLVSTRKSFMPEGLEKDVTPQDLADVISFVQSPPPASE